MKCRDIFKIILIYTSVRYLAQHFSHSQLLKLKNTKAYQKIKTIVKSEKYYSGCRISFNFQIKKKQLGKINCHEFFP